MSAKELGTKYDNAQKAVWRNREILAPLLRYCVRELEDETVESVMRLIDADSISEDTPVSDLPPQIVKMETEFPSTTEKSITFDCHFLVGNPKLSTKALLVRIHIDLELQNEFNPTLKDGKSYFIEQRAFYYVARDLSSQLGRITENTNYADLEKAISIWIVSENVPKNLQKTVSRYYIQKEDVIGEADIEKRLYDLLEVVIVRRGKNGKFDAPVFDYLNAVFAADLEKIDQYTPASTSPMVVKEVSDMSGAALMLLEKGRNEGRREGYRDGQREVLMQVSALISYLFKNGRKDELAKVAEDHDYLDQLLDEYQQLQASTSTTT